MVGWGVWPLGDEMEREEKGKYSSMEVSLYALVAQSHCNLLVLIARTTRASAGPRVPGGEVAVVGKERRGWGG